MAAKEIIELRKRSSGEAFYPLTHIDAVVGLDSGQFFETVTNQDGSVSIHLKSEYSGLWTDGFLSAGGIGSASGGGGGGGTGTITSIGLNAGTGLSVSSSGTNPITSSGTFTVSIASTHKLPTTGEWSGLIGLIPSAATSSNQLADKAFVNSSIASSTGTFQGTYSSVSQLPTTGVSVNDYAFVTTTDANNNTVYNRYKYNGSAWVFEYALNNSSFTAVQWEAINSGINTEKVAHYDTLVSNVQADWNASTGLSAILNKPTLATVATSGNYNDLTNRPSIPDAPVQSDWWQTDTTALDFIKNKPAIPTVNNATLTIQMNSSTKGTFSANASQNVTIDLGTVITSHQSLSNYVTKSGSDTIRGAKTMYAGLIIDGLNSGYLQVSDWSDILCLNGPETLDTALANRDNIIESVKVNGSALTPDSSKAVNITVPVAGTNFLTPSQIASTYQTKLTAGIDYLTPSAIANAYLPKTGGTLSAGRSNVLTIQNSNSNEMQIILNGPSFTLGSIEWGSYWGINLSGYGANGQFRGKLGILADGTPYFAGSNYTSYELLHANNWKDRTVLDMRAVGLVEANTDLNELVDQSKTGNIGWFRFYSNVLRTATSSIAAVHGFPVVNSANAMLTIDTYNDGSQLGVYQLGFSGNGYMYYRYGFGATPFTGSNWNSIMAMDYEGKWYPDKTNYPNVYIRWDPANGAFEIHGNMYATGQVASGGTL